MNQVNVKAIAVAAIGLFASVFLSACKNTTDTKHADQALEQAHHILTLVLADQNDGMLANGTVIQVNGNVFVYEGSHLTATQNIPDTSAAITTARIGRGDPVVYLFSEDGEPTAYSASSDVVYENLINPSDDTIETYTYSQINQAAQNFLDEVSYDKAADTASEISKYVDSSMRYDRPAGCTVELEAGELTVFDNGTKQAYTVTVEKGPYTFYNITPDVGGEFYVMHGNYVVQKGHLRPTGTLRMIHSDTDGLQNIRDLGGWPCDGGSIKYNMLIRGGMVIDATDTDRNTWIKLLGIENDLFLKTYSDSHLAGREEYRVKSPLGENITLYQMDLSEDGSENKRNFSQAKEQMSGIINELFDNAIAGETTYFHCLAGADRTGMVAIIVEGVLGVSKADIDRDYELTSFSTLRERNNAMYIADINILRGYVGASFRDKCVQYLLDCGITLEKINAFRRAVIDGTPEEITVNKLDAEPKGTNFCVPDGDGWIDGGRCSSSGEDRADAQDHVLTNYFAVQNGDIVYVKNLHVTDRLYSGMYRSDRTAIIGFPMTVDGGAGFVKDIILTDEWEVFTIDHSEAGYLRLCGMLKLTKEDVIVYINRNGEWLY